MCSGKLNHFYMEQAVSLIVQGLVTVIEYRVLTYDQRLWYDREKMTLLDVFSVSIIKGYFKKNWLFSTPVLLEKNYLWG